MLKVFTSIVFTTFLFFNSLNLFANQGNSLSIDKGVIFKENKGQVRDQNNNPRPDVLFSGSVPGFVFHLKKDGMHYQTYKVESWMSANTELMNSKNEINKTQSNQLIPKDVSIYRVDVNWIGSNPNPILEFGEKLPGYENYYNVPVGVAPALEVRSYRSITLKNIYDGIDLKYYQSENGELEYDFIVQPGADYRQIQLEFKGTNPKINNSNELVLTTPYGEIREGSLKVYQEDKQIIANWVKTEDKITFEIPTYDPTKPIRIDPPTRFWGTYFGDIHEEQILTMKTDNEFIYIGGMTQSLNNIATTGAHQTKNGSFPTYYPDGFIAKFQEKGHLEWATYYGGTSEDYISGIATDSYGDIYFCGYTRSQQNIATPGSFKDAYYSSDAWEGFLGKFTSYGQRVWASYYGGQYDDVAKSIAVDNLEFVYLCGYTSGAPIMATSGAHQTTYGGGGSDAFLAKFSTNGSRMWGTFYGGNNYDRAYVCLVDLNHNIYIAGETASTNNISTIGAHQEVKSTNYDGFLAKFNTNGVRQWATYYGGNGEDKINAATLDQNDNIFIAGSTESSDNIATSGSYQSSFGGFIDGFFSKFNPNGTRQWGSYYGGGGADPISSIVCTHSDILYISGYTTSASGIATPDGFKTNSSGYDAYIAKLLPNGSRQWGTYYGGNYEEYGNYIDIDTYGSLYLAGYTGSTTNIATEGSFKSYFSGTNWTDGFLVKFNPCQTLVTATSNSPVCECGDVELTASEGYSSYYWFEGSIFLGEGRIYKAQQCTTGVYTYRVVAYDAEGCSSYADVEFEVVYPQSVSVWYDAPICVGNDLKLNAEVNHFTLANSKKYKNQNKIQGNPEFYWTGPNGFTSTEEDPIINNVTKDNEGIYTLTFKDENGCTNTHTLQVFIGNGPEVTPYSNSPVCEGETLYLFGDYIIDIVKNDNKENRNKIQEGEYIYFWTGPNDFSSSEKDPVIDNVTIDMAGTYYLTVTEYMGCSSTYEINVEVGEVPTAIINSKSGTDIEYLCEGDDYTFDVTSDADYYFWTGPNDFMSTDKNPTLTNLQYYDAGEYILTAYNESGCSTTTYLEIIVNNAPIAYPGSNSPLCEGNDLYLFSFYYEGEIINNSKKDYKNKLQNGYQYQWTGPNEFYSEEMDPVIENATIANSGRYFLTVKNYVGCTNTYYIDVTINESPSFQVTTNSPLCAGGTLSLQATGEGNYTYFWTGPNGFSAVGPNPTITGVTPTYSGTYTCMANNAGCSTTKLFQVTINPKPSVTANSNSPQCQGGTLNLFAEGPTGSTYQWSGPNGFSSTLQNPVINNVGTSASGVYTVTCKNEFNCTATATVSVTINPKPNVTASYNAPVYVGETIQFDATAGFASYQWTGPNSFSSNLRNPSISNAQSTHSGTYTLTVTNSQGCSSTVTLEVQVIDEEFDIDLFITPELQKVAYGKTLQPAFTSSVTTSKYTYKWYYDEDTTPENGNETLIATTIHLGLSNIKFEDEGYYYLKVSYGNEYEISNVAQLLVTAKQPKNNSVISRSQDKIKVSWENPDEGQGDGVLVVVSKNSDYNNNILPKDGTTYAANSQFGDNSKTTGTKHYVVYNGSGNEVQVTNLTRGTYYRFRWFAYKNEGLISPTYNTDQSQNNPRSINTNYREFDEETYLNGTKMSLGRVFPNPVGEDGAIQFNLVLENSSNVEVKILSTLGETIYKSYFDLSEGYNIVLFDLYKKYRLPNGTYILQVTNEEESLQQAFIIVH